MPLSFVKGHHSGFPTAYYRVIKLSPEGRVTRAEYGSTKTIGSRRKLYTKLRLDDREVEEYMQSYHKVAIAYRVSLLALCQFFARREILSQGQIVTLSKADHRAIAQQMEAYRQARFTQADFRW